MYKVLLIDLDNTLLDFDLAQKKALITTLIKYGVEPTDDNVQLFRNINTYYWEEYEKERITKADLLVKRFDEFFKIFNLKRDCEEANTSFLLQLSYGSDKIEHSDEVLEKLSERLCSSGWAPWGHTFPDCEQNRDQRLLCEWMLLLPIPSSTASSHDDPCASELP